MNRKPPQLTTSAGNPVADNQSSITAGSRGPLTITHNFTRYSKAISS